MAWWIFWLFDIAWVYQAIESHALYMAFNPSTDPGIDNIRIGCFFQWTIILISYYIHIYIPIFSYMHYTHI